jgi:opacity protein-like surface antigen
MRRSVVRVCVVSVAVMAWPQIASAQWYVNPYVGQVFKIEQPFSAEFGVPSAPDKATVFGVAAGTSPLGRLGLEIDFQRVNNMFREGDTDFSEEQEALTGSNNLQSFTGAVHFGRPSGANGRFRPYGVAGGGLGIVNLGTEVEPDFEAFFNLPLPQQQAIDNCVIALGTPTPTVAQVSGCGYPLFEEELVGYRALLTFGGGLTVRLAKNLAAKGDVRYFREIPTDSAGAFTFWRITVGVVIHR